MTAPDSARNAQCALEQLAEQCASCVACALAATRTNVVFGAGDASARVMIIGEAPGKNEDLTGEPFVGAAGKKLDAMLERAGIKRSDVYIANICKCRPPKNRNPKQAEITACTPWLKEQLELVHPECVITLGNFATRYILQTNEGITSLRGRVHSVDGLSVLPMFHPAACIYDRSKVAALEADFDLLGSLLGSRPAKEDR